MQLEQNQFLHQVFQTKKDEITIEALNKAGAESLRRFLRMKYSNSPKQRDLTDIRCAWKALYTSSKPENYTFSEAMEVGTAAEVGNDESVGAAESF